MKKQIPKAKGFGIVKPDHLPELGISIEIPELNTHTGHTGKLLSNSLLNYIMRKFIKKLADRKLADKAVLSDLEFIIEDYLINYELRFENNDDIFDDYDY